MRLVFLFLLGINLLVAGWMSSHLWRAERDSDVVVEPAAMGVANNLRLLHELPAADRVRVVFPPEKGKPAEPPAVIEASAPDAVVAVTADEMGPHTESLLTTSCYRISDIARKDYQEGLAAKISALNMTVVERGEEFNERQTHWVYIPPLKNNAAAQDVMGALAKAKVRDYLLVRSGEFQYAISLGVFSQREGANKRVEEIASLRLKAPRPVVGLRTSTYRGYWLLAKGMDGVASLERQLQQDSVTVSPVDCPP